LLHNRRIIIVAGDQAEWRLANDPDGITLHHRANIIASCISYLAFGLILYSCKKRRIFSHRFSDVLLILSFAFLSDLAKTRLHIYFYFSEGDYIWHFEYYRLPTTVGASTIGMWVIYSQLLIAYIQAVVALYRFVVRYRPKPISTSYIYYGIGIAFALHIWFFFDTFLIGTPTDLGYFKMPVYCSRAYTLSVPALISKAATTYILAIVPIVSLITACKKSKAKDDGVTSFVFIPSFIMAALVYLFLFDEYLPDYAGFLQPLNHCAYTLNDFRFPLMCILAVTMVKDIRDAFVKCASDLVGKLFGHKEAFESITNESYIE
ncbi:hypothetical protein PMAYCL1PPCAC_22307, partial [Pristionchus mayeri]